MAWLHVISLKYLLLCHLFFIWLKTEGYNKFVTFYFSGSMDDYQYWSLCWYIFPVQKWYRLLLSAWTGWCEYNIVAHWIFKITIHYIILSILSPVILAIIVLFNSGLNRSDSLVEREIECKCCLISILACVGYVGVAGNVLKDFWRTLISLLFCRIPFPGHVPVQPAWTSTAC